ncbi:MAG: CHAT domain-containing protein [Pleurocapsa sp. MO_192.B19]|nr:CHAT domain-containing protein [Pleurocapsa sp. MO_192.B19]
MQRRILVFLISAWLAVALHLPVQSQEPNALQLAQEAQQLYRAGKLVQSATTWQQAAALYQEQGDRLGRTKSLINQSQALQDLGLYPKACKTLLKAFEVKHPDCNNKELDKLIQRFEARENSYLTTTQGIGLRSLGDVLRRKGILDKSQRLLKLSVLATQDSTELGATLLALGNVEQVLGNQTRDRWDYDYVTEIIDRQDPELALEPYSDAFLAYEKTAVDEDALPITQIQAQLNYLDLSIKIEDWWQRQTTRRIQSWQRLNQMELTEAANNFSTLLKAKLDQTRDNLITAIEDNWTRVTPSHQGIYAQINYTKSLTRLGQTAKVKSILQTALKQAQTIQDKRGESYVMGYLGQYYGQQGQLNKAIALTNQALMLAEAQNINGNAREVTYLWQSQIGQLLEQEGKTAEAIAAYTSAFNTLQSLRTDLNANNQVVQFDFRQEVKPVYLQLANLLLQEDNNPQKLKSLTSINSTNTQKTDANHNLELARQVIESLQLAELDNFFQDPCSETSDIALTIDDLDPQAAVIYPIVMPDRLEVIFSVAGKPLQKFTTVIPETTVNQTLDLLYDSLYNPSINNSAVNIFSTTPLNPRELEENTQTLLPTLEQVYNWLIEPLESELASNQIKTLIFVSNGRLQNVPMAALYDGQQYLLEKYSMALAPSLQLVDTQSIPREKVKVLAAGLSQQVEIQGEIFPALANVPEELRRIKAIFPQSRQLLDQEFTTESIRQYLQAGFPVVHLATHGLFSSDPQQTFIVTGDRDIIDIKTLSTLLGSTNSSKPELIVLSACDTATGDERAILGLAGVAVRSGSSTLASLWSVEDASTAELMSQFYREFENPTAKKADALQNAQLSLIKSLRARPPLAELKQLPPHPYYWAPYVLVGNWL